MNPVTFSEPYPRGERDSRVLNAIHYAIDNPQERFTKKGKEYPIISNSQHEAIGLVEGFAAENRSQLRLRDLLPPQDGEDVTERLERMKIMPVGTEAYAKVVGLAKTQPKEYWITDEAKKMLSDLNGEIYTQIEQHYNVHDGKLYFKSRMAEVQKMIRDIIERRLSDAENTLSPINEETFAVGPAHLIQMSVSPHSFDKLQAECLRSLVLLELSSEIEHRARGVDEVVRDLQMHLDTGIFNHGQKVGEGKEDVMYGFFDNKTNTPVWLSDISEPLTSQTYSEVAARAHLKKIITTMRDAGEFGEVLTNPRNKASASEKAIRKADTRKKLVGDDFLEPSELTDLVGIMLVSKRGKSRELIEHVRQVLIDNMRFREEDIKTRNKDGTSNVTPEKSEDVRYERLDATLPPHLRPWEGSAPIEIMAFNMDDYIRYSFETGTEEDNYHGQAHDLYEVNRDSKVITHLFPGFDATPAMQRNRETVVFELKRAKQVKKKELPGKYRSGEEKKNSQKSEKK